MIREDMEDIRKQLKYIEDTIIELKNKKKDLDLELDILHVKHNELENYLESIVDE